MITFYYFTHRFKRSMLEIIPTEPSFDLSWEHVSPLYKEQFLANVTFSVVTGKKSYDIIRVNQDIGVFYSKKIIKRGMYVSNSKFPTSSYPIYFTAPISSVMSSTPCSAI